MPTERWVFPEPALPISSRPVLSTGYSSTNLYAAIRACNRCECGPSNSKFDSSQCSYRFGIRAAEINAPPRARIWQSQRVTPPSGASATTFHPEPAHSGQASTAVFIASILYLNFAPEPARAATRKRRSSVYILWRAQRLVEKTHGNTL